MYDPGRVHLISVRGNFGTTWYVHSKDTHVFSYSTSNCYSCALEVPRKPYASFFVKSMHACSKTDLNSVCR